MNVENNRLRTFEGWPANAEVEPQRIAKAGFFSTGRGLEVQCFCCGGKISEWNYGDQVMARHRALDPQCPFVKNPIQSGNVPTIPGDSPAPPGRSSQPDGAGPSSSTVGDTGTWDQGTTYRSEAARLESFRSWPIPFIVAPERLARAGFYYLQQGDRVQCAFCSGVVGHWEAGDDPSKEHRRHFPSCPLHFNVPVGNIPLGQSNDSVQQYQNARDGFALREFRPFSAPERIVVSGGTVSKQHDFTELGIQTHRGPRHPKYATVESRLRTFINWSPTVHQTPQQLAQAGFYSVGQSDQVRCFHCDGGLRHWDPEDDPWTEHARWFSQCGFVLLVKGDEFVQQALIQHPPVLPVCGEESHKTQAVDVRHRVRSVTEEELQGLMSMAPALAALQVGLDAPRIKLALRHKMEQTGMPFTTSDALIAAVLDIQMNEETVSAASSNSSSNSSVNIASRESEGEDDQQSSSPLKVSRSMPMLSDQREEKPDRTKLLTDQSNTKSMPHLLSAGNDSSKAKDDGVPPSLEEEVRRLKEARLCKICMDEEVGVVFLPCGHLVTCVNCAPSLHDCPVCRQLIKATVRTFLS
ncbi:baculoviral IAP repeat-containing protein 7-like isoform X2 [Zootermopsis nevadensis]|uniref:baculoviral IAP repeat-containing protein 7-like isoform X2 n=1 Tax=Zootermopsis nevadensis TaxID=136037 RepID=UPI000B8E7DC0|nr:baculoviral IAP repeat-containing protein 7-like isoform X2 [Zootermopsis nevadensis]